MGTIVIHSKTSWVQRLLVVFCALNICASMALREWVNPTFGLSNSLRCSRGCPTELLMCATELILLLGIGRFAPGASKAQVITVLGPPRFKESRLWFPGCSSATSAADEIWFYEIAPYEHILLRFRGDICFMAGCFEGPEQFAYAQWKSEQIKRRAIGLTRSQIESWLGRCTTNVGLGESFRAVIRRKSSLPGVSHDSPMPFYVGGCTFVELKMENGRCAHVREYSAFF